MSPVGISNRVSGGNPEQHSARCCFRWLHNFVVLVVEFVPMLQWALNFHPSVLLVVEVLPMLWPVKVQSGLVVPVVSFFLRPMALRMPYFSGPARRASKLYLFYRMDGSSWREGVGKPTPYVEHIVDGQPARRIANARVLSPLPPVAGLFDLVYSDTMQPWRLGTTSRV